MAAILGCKISIRRTIRQIKVQRFIKPAIELVLASLLCTVRSAAPAMATDQDQLKEAERLYWRGDIKSSLQILEPLISSSLKDDGEAEIYYGLIMAKCRRYQEAKERISHGMTLTGEGEPQNVGEETLRDLPRQEEQFNAKRAKGAGSVGLFVENDMHVNVFRGSPAHRAGMTWGDQIIAIDATPVTAQSLRSLIDLTRGPVGTPVNVTFKRGGKTYRCRIIREDLDGPFFLEPSKQNRSAISSQQAKIAAGRKNAMTQSGPSQSPDSSLSSLYDKSLVSTTRKTHKTAEVYAAVLRGLSFVPLKIKQELLRQGVKIVVTPSVVEARPDLETASPSGYRYYDSYRYVGAIYAPASNTVYVAETIPYRADLTVKMLDISPTLLHELGHAVDYILKASLSEDYMKAYKGDCQHLSNSDKTTFDYFTDGNENGPRELFAELFALINCPPAEMSPESRGMDKKFPSCAKVVKEQIEQMQQGTK